MIGDDFSQPVHNPDLFALAVKAFTQMPHSSALGVEFIQGGLSRVMTCLPFAENLIGDSQHRVIHGGAITTLIDTTCGLTVFSLLDEPEQVVTLDLRIDYLRSAQPERPVYCVAECYRLTHHVAFLRAIAYQEIEKKELIAHGVSTFMRTPWKKGEKTHAS